MTRLLLPAERPRWYGLKDNPKHVDQEKGWTPQTNDIVQKKDQRSTNRNILEAWNGKPIHSPSKTKDPNTISITDLKLISPLQIGGGSFPEGGILPAQVSGIPWIPGSSIRGSLLHYLRQNWHHIPPEEQAFWATLTNPTHTAWLPKKIRFECVYLDKSQLKPFPLNAQQSWQVFGEPNKHLGVQWQVPADVGMNAAKYTLNITLKETPTPDQKNWITQRMQEMLRYQGLGRGIHAGFGRMATGIPRGQWEIRLQGMKPCIQNHSPNKDDQEGQYRWSPQVLRANLRGWFMRLALPSLGKQGAEALTNRIFGGLGCPAALILCSYKTESKLPPLLIPEGKRDGYVNIPASIAHETWEIQVECNEPFQELIGDLLNLAQQLGGLGPGWRRPPHVLSRFNGFRGSQFTLLAKSKAVDLIPLRELLPRLEQKIRDLALTHGIPVLQQPYLGMGCIFSIWESKDKEPKAWIEIVHRVCSTGASPRPDWCGNSESRPSGYSVREFQDRCRITVLDPKVAPTTLKQKGFQQVWPEV